MGLSVDVMSMPSFRESRVPLGVDSRPMGIEYRITGDGGWPAGALPLEFLARLPAMVSFASHPIIISGQTSTNVDYQRTPGEHGMSGVSVVIEKNGFYVC